MFEMRRLVKQLIYGILYASILWGLSYGTHFLFFKAEPSCFDRTQNQNETGVDCGGVCPACEINALRPVEVLSTRLFFLDGPVVLIELKNSNPSFGAVALPYLLRIFGKDGEALAQFDVQTFIYPGELERFMIRRLPGLDGAARAEVKLGEPQWKSIEEYQKPTMTFRGARYYNEGSRLFATGVLQNGDTLLFPQIFIGAQFFNKQGALVSVSQTEIRDVKAFEERYFQIEHPLIPDIDLGKTKLFIDAKRP